MPLQNENRNMDLDGETSKTLPHGWMWTKLGEICNLINGRAFKPSEWSYEGLPIIRIQNLNNEKSDFNYCNFEVDEKYLVDNGNLLFAWSGTPGTSFGAHIWKGGKAVLNQHIFKVEIDEKNIDKFFLMYLLNYNVDEYIRKSHGTAGLAHITKSKFENSLIPLPPIAEQKRIVAKIEELFTRLDAGVEALKKIKAQIRRYRQAVLKYAFEGKLTEAWRRNNSLSVQSRENSGKLEKDEILRSAQNDERKECQNEIGVEAYNKSFPELPNGWRCVKLGEVAEINPKFSGNNIADHMEVTFLPMKCVEELTGNIDLSNTKKLSEVKKGYTSFIEGDVLFAKITPCMENGKVAIAHNLKNGIGFGSTEFHVIRTAELILNKFLFFFLIQEDFRKEAQRHMTGSAGQLRVPAIYMRQIPIPLPPLPEQHQIVSEIERRFSVIEQIEKIVDQSLKQAERLRQSILKRAFEGKLVPQDPNDEPAEKLLERIRQQREQYDETKISKKKRKNFIK